MTDLRVSRCVRTLGAMMLMSGIIACSNLKPAPKDVPEGLLAGTGWQLQQLGAQGALEANQPTLSFGKGDMVSGTGSCNRFNGSVTVNGKSITFGPLATTRMSCADALNDQEAVYFKALQGAEWFTIEGTTLTIYTKAMDQPLVFLRIKPA